MNKRIFSLALILAQILICVGCTKRSDNISSAPKASETKTSTGAGWEGSVDSTVPNNPDITNTSSGSSGAQSPASTVPSASGPSNNKPLQINSYITQMYLEGYVGDVLNQNREKWLLTALDKNPNIIEQILRANIQNPVSKILTDTFKMTELGIFNYNIADPGHGYKEKSLEIRNLKQGKYMDIDLVFGRDANAVKDWTGVKQIWFFADVSQYGTDSVPVGFAFEEYDAKSNGSLTDTRESWGLKTGGSVYLYSMSSQNGWVESRVAGSSFTTHNPGRIILPAKFKGWVRADLNTQVFEKYWSSGSSNNKMDLKDVHQLQICVEGTKSSTGKSAYLDSFSIFGEIDGIKAPVASPGQDKYRLKEIWMPENYDRMPEQYSGAVELWYNEFVGKLLTGMAFNYSITPSGNLLKAGNKIVTELAKAQGKDGYLGVYTGNQRFGGNGKNWDVWGHYHIIYGLHSWYKATGNSSALTIAEKAIDCVYDYFVVKGRSFDSAGWQTMNLSISHAFIIMYQETGDLRYFNTAKKIVDEEWPKSGDWMNAILSGKDFYQSKLPRWEALHTILTLGPLYELTNDGKYYNALEEIFWSIAKTDRHNTGGFSSGEQAIGHPFSMSAIETCCTVAWMALSSEYLRLSNNPVAADELELSCLNGMLGSLLEDGRTVTYNTPMNGNARAASQIDIAFQYNSGSPDFNCCQANVSRGLGEISKWAVITGNNGMYLNYYGPASIRTKTPGNKPITIRQETAYPLNGDVKIILKDIGSPEKFKLSLRIPSWSAGTKVSINGRPQSGVKSGEYFTIERTWKNGDIITVDIGMTIHSWRGELQAAGKLSIYYGPVLMTAEGTDAVHLSRSEIILYNDLKKLSVIPSTDKKHWIQFKFTTSDNRTFTLFDFASAGKTINYETWFKVKNAPAKTDFSRKTPVWCNGRLPI